MNKTLCYRVTLTSLLLAATAGAWAQVIYRSVDSYGRITYSDQPMAPAAKALGIVNEEISNPNAGLPYVLIQAMGQYPVTLYTGPQCGGACTAARALLVKRGIPFTENTVSTQQDIDVLQRIGGDTGLPFLTIGGQHLRGFSDVEWNRYLDAAGYPATSQLPPGYRQAPASALASIPVAPAAPASAAPAAPAAAPTSKPVGIQF